MGNVVEMATQSRLDNLHTGMNFTGKPDQIVESNVKPLMDSEKFEAQLAASKSTRRPRYLQQAYAGEKPRSCNSVRPNQQSPATVKFSRERARPWKGVPIGPESGPPPMGSEHSDTGIQDPIQEPSLREADYHAPKFLARPPADVTPAAEQEEANQGGERYPNEGSISAVGEARDRGGSATNTGLLQPTIYDSEGDWRPPTRPGSEKPQSELQEIPQVPIDRPVISVQVPSFWAVTQPPDIYEDSTIGSRMGQIQGYADFGIPRKHVDPGRDQGYLQIQHASGILQALGAWIPRQQGQILDHTITINHAPGDGSSNVNCHTPGEAHAVTSVRVEESVTHQDKFMDVDCCLNDTSIPKSIILEEPTEVMERPLVLFRDPGIRNITGFQRFGLGNSSGVPFLLGNMVPLRGVDAHQIQGAENSYVCTKTQEREGQISPCLPRQHDDSSIREEVWGHHITQTSGNIRGNLGTLPEDEHQAPGNLHTFSFEPRRRPEQTDCTNRMVVIPRDIRKTERKSWSPRSGSICFPPEQEGGSLLKLVPKPQGCGSELTGAQLVGVEQPILLPTLEINSTGSSETTQGENNYDPRNFFVEISDLVSGSEGIFDMPTVSTASNYGNPGPGKRKIPALDQQTLEINGLEDQRSFLKAQGLGTHAVDCILSNERMSSVYPGTTLSSNAF
ncbi:hypothetical protein AYI69_g8291 [Smittium culicis]|uniref:Uncharacterized protein n=1 Tax=Smittium culicis TaxID=133412 RepID=A0A1R1XKN8_9FUNG|nr:hypothetical protein AYI69_g8291 [Smittium culicis]